MKNLGTVVITKDEPDSFTVNLSVFPDKVYYDISRYNISTNAFVKVHYSGIHAGTVESMNNHIVNQVENYLYENGYLNRVKSNVLFRDYDYVPSQKLLSVI